MIFCGFSTAKIKVQMGFTNGGHPHLPQKHNHQSDGVQAESSSSDGVAYLGIYVPSEFIYISWGSSSQSQMEFALSEEHKSAI
jgi:hypothetical protein